MLIAVITPRQYRCQGAALVQALSMIFVLLEPVGKSGYVTGGVDPLALKSLLTYALNAGRQLIYHGKMIFVVYAGK